MEGKTSKYTFSVITPAYNTAKYIGSCIESVINTGYDLSKVEHIIVDDGSTDNTSEVVKKYAKKYPHIKLYCKENSNWGGVMNYIKKNKLLHNDYATICDSDDQLTKNAFDAINKYSQDDDLIFGCFYRWNGKKQLLPVHTYFYIGNSCDVYSKSRKKNIPPLVWLTHGAYFKKELFYKIDDLKEKVFYQDSILLTHLFTNAKSVRFVNKMLAKYYCTRPNNSSTVIKTDKSTMVLLDNLKQMANKDLPTPVAASLIYFSKLRRYCMKHNIKFTCSDTPDFDNTNFLVRIAFWLAYFLTGTFRLFRKKDSKKSNKKINLKQFKKDPKKITKKVTKQATK